MKHSDNFKKFEGQKKDPSYKKLISHDDYWANKNY